MSNKKTQGLGVLIFKSLPPCIGKGNNTSFATTPTLVTADNALDVFKYDYSPIAFKNGYRAGKNFEYACSIPADFDNSHSENPDDWQTADSLYQTFVDFGVNFILHSSRNDNRLKIDKRTGEKKTARPKFHCDFPLWEPVYDRKIFAAHCGWFIENHRSDPKVKSPSQQIFGHGDHPDPIIKIYMGGKCIDQILTESDLSIAPPILVVEKRNNIPQTVVPVQAHANSGSAFDRFVKSGEWKKHLGDLKKWVFIEKKGVFYFQTPAGSRGRDDQDGNIKNGVAYFFSKAPAPFENDKGYSIPKFFAGALFGDIGKAGLAKFANRYLD